MKILRAKMHRRNFRWAVGLLAAICWIAVPAGPTIARPVILQEFDESNFELWAYGGLYEKAMREKFRSQAEIEIRKLHELVDLSESQKDRIRIAGEGDIARFFRTVERAKQAAKAEAKGQNTVEILRKHVSPIQQLVSKGIFDDPSLLKKVSEQVLTDEQRMSLQSKRQDEVKVQLALYIKLRLAKLDQQIPFTIDQRKQLMALIQGRCEKATIPVECYKGIAEFALDSTTDEVLLQILDREQLAELRKVLESTRNFRNAAAPIGWKLD